MLRERKRLGEKKSEQNMGWGMTQHMSLETPKEKWESIENI